MTGEHINTGPRRGARRQRGQPAWILVLASVATPVSAVAQPPAPGELAEGADQTAPVIPPDAADEDIQRALRELAASAARPAPVAPAGKPAATTPTGTGRNGLLREGVFLLERRGRVAKAPAGQLVFVFDPVEGQPVEPPMVLLPNGFLADLRDRAQRAGTAGDAVGYVVSGQVMVYRGRNYLLLTRPAGDVVNAKETAPTGPMAAPIATQPAAPARPSGDLESPLEVIADLERAAPARPPRPSIMPEAERTDGPRVDDRAGREGGFVASRRCRVVPTGAGGWAVVFDADSGAPTDGPLHLLPCVKLMEIEALIGSSGDAVSLRLSGQVFRYDGRAYLLPTMVTEQPRTSR